MILIIGIGLPRLPLHLCHPLTSLGWPSSWLASLTGLPNLRAHEMVTHPLLPAFLLYQGQEGTHLQNGLRPCAVHALGSLQSCQGQGEGSPGTEDRQGLV